MNCSPTILLIFANDRKAYLEGIRKEREQLINILQPAIDKLKLELEVISYSDINSMIDRLNALRERLVVLHFAGHSDIDFLQLDEGAVYASGLATKLVKCPNLKLVFFNGCNNATLAKTLVHSNIPHVIGTRQLIGDDVAKSLVNDSIKH